MRFIRTTQEDKDLLKALLETAPSGLDIGQVRRSIRVIDKIDGANDLLILEDTDYEHLRERFHQTKFVRVTRELVELADKLDGAATVNPAE